jgi:hypothetical protein
MKGGSTTKKDRNYELVPKSWTRKCDVSTLVPVVALLRSPVPNGTGLLSSLYYVTDPLIHCSRQWDAHQLEPP